MKDVRRPSLDTRPPCWLRLCPACQYNVTLSACRLLTVLGLTQRPLRLSLPPPPPPHTSFTLLLPPPTSVSFFDKLTGHVVRRSKQIAGVKVQTLTFLTQGRSQNFPKRGRRANLIVFVGRFSNNNKKEEEKKKEKNERFFFFWGGGGGGWKEEMEGRGSKSLWAIKKHPNYRDKSDCLDV